MKKNNPHTPIMIREALDVPPRIFARYGTLADGSGVGESRLKPPYRIREREAGVAEWSVGLLRVNRLC